LTSGTVHLTSATKRAGRYEGCMIKTGLVITPEWIAELVPVDLLKNPILFR
jgi:hypothetical protein